MIYWTLSLIGMCHFTVIILCLYRIIYFFLSAVVNSGVDKAIYTKMSGHKINTPHLSRYIEVSNETKKNVVDSICPLIDDKYESVLFNKNID